MPIQKVYSKPVPSYFFICSQTFSNYNLWVNINSSIYLLLSTMPGPKNTERWENSKQPTLRDEEDYYIPHTRLCSLDRQPLVYFPKSWNDFVKEFGTIGSIPSKTLLKKELKSHFLNKLTDDYQCGRLLCPHCHYKYSLVASGTPIPSLIRFVCTGSALPLVPLLGPPSLPL